MIFHGRKKELKKLRDAISAPGMGTMLVYGRRRVGKSELVKQAISTADTVYMFYECKQLAEQSNAEGLNRVTAEALGLPKLGYQRIEDILEYIFKAAVSKKMILVLDEYPYLRANIAGMDSILQSLIDGYRDSTQLKLVLLGSYVDVMKSLLGKANPLFGRMDVIIDLKQMDYYEAAEFYPAFSPADRVRIYSVFGGIPYYNRLIDDRRSVKENIMSLIASEGARLENEVPLYLGAEIAKMTNANEVFSAMARGYSKYSDILSQSHVSSGPTLVDIMDKLISMEVVIRTAPINDENNRRKAGYHICDNLSLFYYRYMFAHASQLKIMDPDTFYDRYIHPDFEESYVPHGFERIARQYLVRANQAGMIDPVLEKIGKYYYDDPVSRTNGEFDVVAKDEKGYVFYEVKFMKNRITEAMISKEIEQVRATGLRCHRYVFIARSGFTGKETAEIKHVMLDELYKEGM